VENGKSQVRITDLARDLCSKSLDSGLDRELPSSKLNQSTRGEFVPSLLTNWRCCDIHYTNNHTQTNTNKRKQTNTSKQTQTNANKHKQTIKRKHTQVVLLEFALHSREPLMGSKSNPQPLDQTQTNAQTQTNTNKHKQIQGLPSRRQLTKLRHLPHEGTH
jgi:hypothetical protein